MIPSTLILTCSDNWPFRKLNFVTFEISFTSCTSDLKTSQKLSHFLRSPSKTGNAIFGNFSAECFSCLETPESAYGMDLELWSCWARRRSFSICLNKAECVSEILSASTKSWSAVSSSPSITWRFWISLSSCLISGLTSRSFCWPAFNCSMSSSAISASAALSKIGASFLPSLVNIRRKLPLLLTAIFKEFLSWSAFSVIMNCEFNLLEKFWRFGSTCYQFAVTSFHWRNDRYPGHGTILCKPQDWINWL